MNRNPVVIDLVTVERQDLEEVLGLLVDWVNLPDVWGDTIARFEEALGMTLAQVKSRRGGLRSRSMFKHYRRKQIAELRPYVPGESMADISVNGEDVKAGSPKAGDMIARNPANHKDQWLVAAAYFAANFEALDEIDSEPGDVETSTVLEEGIPECEC